MQFNKHIPNLISVENAQHLYIRLFHFIFHRNEIGGLKSQLGTRRQG